jgi:hypothetical protein
MHVKVQNGLSRRRAVIDPDVITRRTVMSGDMLSRAIQQGKKSGTFDGSRREEGFNVSLWKDKAMPWGDWVAIEYPNGMLVFAQDSFCGQVTVGARTVARHDVQRDELPKLKEAR